MSLRVALTAAAAVCLASAAAATPPIEAYGRLPAIDKVDLSDDGTTVAYLARKDGAQSVVVQTLTGEVLASADLGDRKVRSIEFGGPDHVLISVSQTTDISSSTVSLMRGEYFVATALNIRTGKSAPLIRRADNQVANTLQSDPVVTVVDGKPTAFVQVFTLQGDNRLDVYKVDLDTGAAKLAQMGSQDTRRFLLDETGRVYGEIQYEDRRGRWKLSLRDAKGRWATAHEQISLVDTPSVFGLDREGDAVLVQFRKDDDDEAPPISEISLVDLSVKEAFPADFDSLLRDVEGGRLIGVARSSDGPRYEFFDPARQAAWAKVAGAFGGKEVTPEAWTRDGKRMLVKVEGAGESGSVFHADLDAGKVKLVGRDYPEIKGADVAQVRPIRYAAADGLQIDGFLTVPPGRELKNLPLVVMPHGGPEAEDEGGFDWWAQALASRGYAVLQPNFRGSTNRGVEFIQAGYGEWGRKMQTDVSDGVRYLASRSLIDPKRVCVVGASYGGYVALAGVTVEQGVYRCAVSVAGVSDLRAMLNTETRTSGDATVRYWKRFMGADGPGAAALDGLSPAQLAAKADAPVLLIHGRDDTVVPYAQSTMMQKALKAAGKPVDFVELEDEDHWLSSEATRTAMLKAAVAFVEKHNPAY